MTAPGGDLFPPPPDALALASWAGGRFPTWAGLCGKMQDLGWNGPSGPEAERAFVKALPRQGFRWTLVLDAMSRAGWEPPMAHRANP